MPHISAGHTNYNHDVIPEQPPCCAVLFTAKQTGLCSPDELSDH